MLLYYKANFCDLCESSVHRVRFPLASVIGLRLQPGKKPSAKDDHLSVPHVLILELRSPVSAEGIATRKTNPEFCHLPRLNARRHHRQPRHAALHLRRG